MRYALKLRIYVHVVCFFMNGVLYGCKLEVDVSNYSPVV